MKLFGMEFVLDDSLKPNEVFLVNRGEYLDVKGIDGKERRITLKEPSAVHITNIGPPKQKAAH